MDGKVKEYEADVAVIGAGIIGLFNALLYAKRGLNVVIMDNIIQQKRSYKVGESLLIFSNPFLRNICELDDFIVQSYPKAGVWFCYGMEGEESFENKTEWGLSSKRSWFDDMPKTKLYRSAFHDAQLVRPEVEEYIREVVFTRYPNITFLDSARVSDIILHEDNKKHEVKWICQISQEHGTTNATWLIDCSGRNRLMAKKFGHAKEHIEFNDGFQTTALWAQFKGISDEQFGQSWNYTYPSGDVIRRNDHTSHLWGDGYWIWVIRLSNGRISIGVTFDQRKAPDGANPKEQFWNVISRYPLLMRFLKEENVLEFRMYKNVQYMTDTFISPKRYGMVGDAATIIDAYYSQGISLALVSSWHIANIAEQDIRDKHLELKYIERVNRATKQDWYMLRNIVKSKYTSAIKDSRFFIMSHLIDGTIFGSSIISVWHLSRLLVETGGETAKETKIHKKIKNRLIKRLFYSQTSTWFWLSPEIVQKIQKGFQEQLAERALWRQRNGISLPAMKAIHPPLPKIWLLAFKRKKEVINISGQEMKNAKWFIPGEKTISPISLRIVGSIFLIVFLIGYFYDWAETSFFKILKSFGLLPKKASIENQKAVKM